MVREVETEKLDQASPKDWRQMEQPQDKKLVEISDARKETEKQVVTDEPFEPVPYPQRMKKNKLDKLFTKFMEVFKKLHINVPFENALEQMPNYVKFMKDILSRK